MAERPSVPKPMTRWLSPSELAVAGFNLKRASLLAQFADRRRIMGNLVDPLDPATDDDSNPLSQRRPEPVTSMVYLADTGDGFNSTFAVFRSLVEPTALDAASSTGDRVPLSRPQLVVLGGDEVYPVPSREEYDARLVQPLEAAQRATGAYGEISGQDAIRVRAIPGNHDWYDGLDSFEERFLTSQAVGPLRTDHQDRSYWSRSINEHWKIWAVDIGINEEIDFRQAQYFKRDHAETGAKGQSIILAIAKPLWLDEPSELTALYRRLPTQAVRRIGLLLAGDKHFYARHQPDGDEPPMIVSGGGGAYLTLTGGRPRQPPTGPRTTTFDPDADADVDSERAPVSEERVWPSRRTSMGLASRAPVHLPVLNYQLCLLLGTIYALFCMLLLSAASSLGSMTETDGGISEEDLTFLAGSDLFSDPVAALFTTPSLLSLSLLMLGGLYFLTKRGPLVIRGPAATLHLLAHIGGVLLTAGLAARVATSERMLLGVPLLLLGPVVVAIVPLVAWRLWALYTYGRWPSAFRVVFPALSVAGLALGLLADSLPATGRALASFALSSVLIGYLIGGLVLAGYLMVAYLFHVNTNELSAALRIEGYKNFLHLRVDGASLHVHAIGIKHVPRIRYRHDEPEFGRRRPRWGWPWGWVLPPTEPEVIDRLTVTARTRDSQPDGSAASSLPGTGSGPQSGHGA